MSSARSSRRWFPVLALVAVATMINYLDRTVLGIAAPYLTKELGLTAASLGIVFSAFSWSYALLQIPGGIFLDRFGTRTTYTLALTLWSGFTALMGVVSGLPGLILTRIGVGVFEAPCFPANSRVLATWFPQNERARANSIYSVGQYAGIAFLSVPLFWITQQFGWRGLFFMAGGFGILLGGLFWRLYREPSEDSGINGDELAHIEAGGGGEYKGVQLA
jgi:ACS family D-galactonate transporter-like MFS transporter